VRKGTTNELMIPIHPALVRALQAGPVVGMTHIITDARGKPLRAITELIEAAVKRAGLPARCVAHGLRKAALRRLAEHGSTTKEIAAVSGHRSLAEIERHTARADQRAQRLQLTIPEFDRIVVMRLDMVRDTCSDDRAFAQAHRTKRLVLKLTARPAMQLLRLEQSIIR
jgi:hypothetical protein